MSIPYDLYEKRNRCLKFNWKGANGRQAFVTN